MPKLILTRPNNNFATIGSSSLNKNIRLNKNINYAQNRNLTISPFRQQRPLSSLTNKLNKSTEEGMVDKRSKSSILNKENKFRMSYEKWGEQFSTLSSRSNKQTEAHKSLNLRLLNIKDHILDHKDKEIVDLK